MGNSTSRIEDERFKGRDWEADLLSDGYRIFAEGIAAGAVSYTFVVNPRTGDTGAHVLASIGDVEALTALSNAYVELKKRFGVFVLLFVYAGPHLGRGQQMLKSNVAGPCYLAAGHMIVFLACHAVWSAVCWRAAMHVCTFHNVSMFVDLLFRRGRAGTAADMQRWMGKLWGVVNAKGRTPLMLACKAGRTEAVRYLLIQHVSACRIPATCHGCPWGNAVAHTQRETIACLPSHASHTWAMSPLESCLH